VDAERLLGAAGRGNGVGVGTGVGVGVGVPVGVGVGVAQDGMLILTTFEYADGPPALEARTLHQRSPIAG
jgi:hypothetical protein